MSEREVKLTAREPSDTACDAGVDKIDENTRCYVSNYGASADVEIDDEAPQECWQAMHDAAPSDATEALEGLVVAVNELLQAYSTYSGAVMRYSKVFCEVAEQFNRLRATPAGAALIRQAMERDGST